MGNKIPTTTSFNLPSGQEVVLETGKLATLTDGSVVVRIGKTMLLATVVSAKEAREGQDFFPLSVDYQEKFSAIGRIPGNFFRRETKLSDYEVLISRLVDRAIRPLFPDNYLNETQVIVSLISADTEIIPDAYVGLAVSSALMISDIPFSGPISEVRVARIKGAFVINPTASEMKHADMDFIVAASDQSVVMVEGEAKECDELSLVEAIKIAHEAIRIQCDAQRKLVELVGGKALTKREVAALPENKEVEALVDSMTREKILAVVKTGSDKHKRKEQFKIIKEEMLEKLKEEKGEEYLEEVGEFLDMYYDKMKKEVVRKLILDEGIRLDGRGLKDIRPIWTEVDYLPSAHGSAIFTRGETQSLTSLTLGSKSDQMMVDNALDQHYDNFILHYNFPAFSVGEAKPMRAPGRREIGHANLASRSLRQVLPDDNSYTIRLVSDILESNGSSSMATVCAGSMAMMDGGLKIKAAVSGIAMGLVSDGTRTAILSDILGDEDALGDMDFKVTGTEKGITGCQMDIKIEGLSYDLLIEALAQAKEGRIHILNEMKKTIAEPREDYKPHAPRIVQLTIDKSYIGAVIGPGGKIIQEIQEETKSVINIEEVNGKGIVSISSSSKAAIDAALERIYKITFKPEIGGVYEAKVASVKPYGVFVDFQGHGGLLHVSEISHTRIDNVEEVLREGDTVKIKVIGLDSKTGKLRLSRKALMPKPPGAE
jgi:polyribonucleotide nucleotidyltransferase